MSNGSHRRRAFVVGATAGLSLAIWSPTASAQDSTSTTQTTQLDVGGGAPTTSTTRAGAGGGSTSTTQLDVGAGDAAPNRVDAGGGGTAADGSDVPFALIALAGSAVVVTAASAERARRTVR